MHRWIAAAFALALAACGGDTPPPAPPSPPETPAPASTSAAPQAEQKPAPQPDPNRDLAARVKSVLEAEAKIQAAAIDVTAAEGKVTLWGTAASEDERERAAKVAAGVEGVKAVENKIAVVQGS